jgi:hypothetical protein
MTDVTRPDATELPSRGDATGIPVTENNTLASKLIWIGVAAVIVAAVVAIATFA